MPENTSPESAAADYPSSNIAGMNDWADYDSPVSRREQQPVRIQSQPRWMAPAALLVALGAVAVAVWALMSKSDAPAATVGAEGDPKTSVCAAFDTVADAVNLQTHNNLGAEPIAQAAAAGNARLALFGGGQYLLNAIQPDTPKELADSVRSFAVNLQAIGMNALAGVGNENADQAARIANGEQERTKIAGLCK